MQDRFEATSAKHIASTEVNAERPSQPDRPTDGPDGHAPAEASPNRRGRPGGRFHLGGLDGLRALAVTAVLLYHAGPAGDTWLSGGFLGVDLFFVISGFLITTLILEELRSTGTISLRSFLTRRARRLLPALALLLFVTLLGAALFWDDALAEVKSAVVASALYVQNWWLIFHDQNYFASTGRPPPLQHLWSLAIEEQFYLLWPPIVLGVALWLGKSARAGIAVVAALGAIASAVWMGVLAARGNVPFDDDASRIYFGTDTHASALLLGCAAAAVIATHARVRQTARKPRSRVADLLGLAALAAFVWVLFTTSEFDAGLYRGGFLAIAAICVVLVVAVTRQGSMVGRALDVAPVRWVGVRSYGIYLWHWPVFVVTRPVLDISLGAGALLAPRLAITVGIAALSYRFLEQPIRREGFTPWLKRVTAHGQPSSRRRPAILLVGAALVVLLAFGLARGPLVGSSGQEQASFDGGQSTATVQPSAAPERNADAREQPADKPPAVTTEDEPPAATPQQTPTRKLRVTAIGDSVLASADKALRQVFPFLTIDADVGRQANEVFDEIAYLRLGDRLGQIVVIDTGSNGIVSADELDDLLEKLSDRRRVVLVTVHAPRLWQDPNNEIFAEAAERHPNTTLADWNSAANDHPEWLYPDGTHVRPEYAYQYAEIVRSAALDPVPAEK